MINHFLNPARRDNESYQAYRERRKAANAWVRERLKGVLFWDSYRLGTYRKDD